MYRDDIVYGSPLTGISLKCAVDHNGPFKCDVEVDILIMNFLMLRIFFNCALDYGPITNISSFNL